jgi:hypothetical protein
MTSSEFPGVSLDQAKVPAINSAIRELTDLQLAFVGGGIGTTIL